MIVLSPCSEEANTSECAIETFNNIASSLNIDISTIKLVVANRFEITTLKEVQQLL